MTQTEILYEYLKSGKSICDHESFSVLGFPNLRSRVSDLERIYGVKVERKRREGKKYNEYWIELPKPVECPAEMRGGVDNFIIPQFNLFNL